jgi:hypothetical protein
MDHPCVDLPLGAWRPRRDPLFHCRRRQVGEATVWGQLVLSKDLARTECVAGLSLWFQRIPAASPGVMAAYRIKDFLRGRGRLEAPMMEVQNVLRDPVGCWRTPGGDGAVDRLPCAPPTVTP